MILRPATMHDEKLLFDWRNDPSVLMMLHDPTPVTPDGHHRWLNRILFNETSETRLFIAEHEGVSIGQGRIERSWKTLSQRMDTCYLGYSLGKEWRGKGLGLELVSALVALAKGIGYATVACRIKRTNMCSVAVAIKAGVNAIEIF